MKKSTTMLDFFKRKCSTSNSSEVNVELPTTNVAIPILENADVPISENADIPIPENFFAYLWPPGLKSCVRPCLRATFSFLFLTEPPFLYEARQGPQKIVAHSTGIPQLV